MYSSRKPQYGGERGTPGDSLTAGPAPGRPGVGTHSLDRLPRVNTHGPGSGFARGVTHCEEMFTVLYCTAFHNHSLSHPSIAPYSICCL